MVSVLCFTDIILEIEPACTTERGEVEGRKGGREEGRDMYLIMPPFPTLLPRPPLKLGADNTPMLRPILPHQCRQQLILLRAPLPHRPPLLRSSHKRAARHHRASHRRSKPSFPPPSSSPTDTTIHVVMKLMEMVRDSVRVIRASHPSYSSHARSTTTKHCMDVRCTARWALREIHSIEGGGRVAEGRRGKSRGHIDAGVVVVVVGVVVVGCVGVVADSDGRRGWGCLVLVHAVVVWKGLPACRLGVCDLCVCARRILSWCYLRARGQTDRRDCCCFFVVLCACSSGQRKERAT